jgi:hypothetical protein
MKITITIDGDCGGAAVTEAFHDGEVIHTDSPEIHGPVGHDAGQPHVEGDPGDEDEG